ncbi:unnamed protein product [Withania somnifera]
MDPKRRYSYSSLFNLESLINFQLPQLDDDFDYHGNSSQDESRGSPGGATGNQSNGIMSGRELKKKRRTSYSSDEDGDRDRAYSTYISEEKYRTMLGEHIQKYKRRLGNSSASPAATRNGVPMMRSGGGSRDQKSTNDHRGGMLRLGSASDFFSNSTQGFGYHFQSDFAGPYGGNRSIYEPAFLDLGEDITYKIPPPYEKLATSLNLPTLSDIQVNEIYLQGTLDLETLAAMMASDKKLGPRRQGGMGDPKPQFESLQARLRAQPANSAGQKFSLLVSEAALEASSIPEGAAGGIRRSILSEGGVLQVYYVKVLEKGDTYEIIERSLPKKPKLKRDPSVIEKEEMEKIGKYWINLVRKEIPKHHKTFINFHRRQLTDAKRFAETCQREVKMKVSRSLKLMRGAAIRTRKLSRDMLVFWKRVDKEMGLNGILADEMGLGKTIQAMAFLAHLAEDKNIWGPFLVVAPASVLNNWADEIGRFCPDLKTLPYWGGLQERVVLRKNINPKRLYRRDAGFHILITSYQLLVSDEKYFRRVKWQYMVLDEAQAIKSSNSIRWKTLLSFNCRNRLLLTGTPVQNNMAELWALLHFIMPTLFDSHEQFNEWFSKGIENHAEHGGSLNEHQLSRLHAILKPFMLRRVKKDVVSELTGKTEITVHCKLSSRQQAFYQAIKNKISLAELFDSNRGHLNEKKILNLMNIVIQLRKVCNHPELFERNEGSSYFYFGDVPYSLLPAPFGELEDVFYSGGRSPITYQIPKLVYRGANRSSMLHSTMEKGVSKELFEKYFNIYSPDNIHRSILQGMHQSNVGYIQSGTFGFTRLVDMSPMEVAFLATGSLLEKLLFSIVRANRQFLDEILDLESEDDGLCHGHLGRDKVRAVRRMLSLPSKLESDVLRTRLAIGPGDAPFEALVMEHQDRLLSNVNILHSIYSFIPRTRAPPINAHCSDRNFSYKMLEELHHPWIKRLLVGFARTSEYNGPRKPGAVHHLIQEIDSELPITQPALQLTYQIFGSCPPMQPFDPAKMLTDSGKLQTLDILLKRLRAGNHRVLIFAQMTKMLDILEVTVYRLICKETVEEKILQRASQKNTVQQLVMTGGHVQGDLLAPEDVVSLLIDDAQLEQKLKEIPLQAKERKKRKGGIKGIRIGADGDASLEDLTNSESVGNGIDSLEPEKAKSNNKKRKGSTDKKTPRSRSQKTTKNLESVSPNSLMEDDIDGFPQDMQQERPKRLKRPTKSVNENLEPAFTATPPMNREGNHNYPPLDISSGGGRAEAEEEALRHNTLFVG